MLSVGADGRGLSSARLADGGAATLTAGANWPETRPAVRCIGDGSAASAAESRPSTSGEPGLDVPPASGARACPALGGRSGGNPVPAPGCGKPGAWGCAAARALAAGEL